MDSARHACYMLCPMAGTHAGAIKRAASVAGCSPAEYLRRVARGHKWCIRCKTWHPVAAFGSDRSRPDGLAAACILSRKRHRAATYVKKVERVSTKGRRYVPIRNGDKKQARHRVNHLVDTNRLPNPNTIACVDCGHLGGRRRHEYDHHLGYAPEHHESVQAVCAACHRKRAVNRGEWHGKKHVNRMDSRR